MVGVGVGCKYSLVLKNLLWSNRQTYIGCNKPFSLHSDVKHGCSKESQGKLWVRIHVWIFALIYIFFPIIVLNFEDVLSAECRGDKV